MNDNKVFTVPEVKALLKVSAKTVYRLIQRGRLKAVNGIRHKLITADSLTEFLNN